MPFQKVQKANHFYLFQDFGQERTLLFSNSLGADHTMWDPQIEDLSSHYNILRYDTRGHGQSETTPGEYDVALLGRDVLGLLDALQLPKVVFCGLSMGGLIGQWLLHNAAERFHAVVLCNTALKIGTHDSWNQRIASVASDGLEPLLEPTSERWFSAEFRARHPERVQAVLDVFAGTSPQGYAANCAMVREADFRDAPDRGSSPPVLIVSGEQDGVTTVEHGHQLAEALHAFRHVHLNAAHLSNVEAAQAFNAELASL